MTALLQPILRWLRVARFGRPARVGQAMSGLRRDETLLAIQPGLALLVYWKVTPIGRGPAVILQTDTVELMKFDCFGGDGHFHISPWYSQRLAFVERTVEQQIDRSLAEIRQNAEGYLRAHPRAEIASIVVDADGLARAVEAAAPLMRDFAVRTAALDDGPSQQPAG